MQLRRMPADRTGRTAYCQPGGLMEAMANDAEERIIRTAAEDVKRAEALLKRHTEVTRAEITYELSLLVQSAKAAVDVAKCRGERLETLD